MFVHLDDDLLQAMHEESLLMGDERIEETIARRLVEGVALAGLVGPEHLLWRPVHIDALEVEVGIPREVASDLVELATLFGYEPSILACTILYNDACRPHAVRKAIASARYSPIRKERGRGSIYSVKFELPGYQLIFLKLLGAKVVTRDEVVGEALLSLAREIQITGQVGGRPVADDALDFARQIMRSPAWSTSGAHG